MSILTANRSSSYQPIILDWKIPKFYSCALACTRRVKLCIPIGRLVSINCGWKSNSVPLILVISIAWCHIYYAARSLSKPIGLDCTILNINNNNNASDSNVTPTTIRISNWVSNAPYSTLFHPGGILSKRYPDPKWKTISTVPSSPAFCMWFKTRWICTVIASIQTSILMIDKKRKANSTRQRIMENNYRKQNSVLMYD